jgi:cytochrome c-type biogenesis protein CcmH/NrfG
VQTFSQPTVTPPPPPTLLELASAAMAQRQPKVAVEALRREVREQGETAETLRLLGVALAMDRRWLDAAAVMRSAYRLDPKLATAPLDAAAAGVDGRRLRELVKGAVLAANRGESASEWLLVAALMQAEGRNELSSTMASRAAKAGLEPEIASGFGVGVRDASQGLGTGFPDRK